MALDLATNDEGVEGLEEFEWVWESEKLRPGLVLVFDATELLGLMTCAGWTDFLNPGLRDTPQKAGLEGDTTRPGLEARAGLDNLPKSISAGLEVELLTPAARK